MRAALIVLGVVLAGCGNHVELRLPSTMGPQQRVAAYAQLREGSKGTETITTCASRGGCATTKHEILMLSNGEIVRHAEDLEPVVDPTSETGAAVEKVKHRIRVRRVIKLLTALTVVGGIYVVGRGGEADSENTIALGIGMIVVGGLGGLFAVIIANDAITDASHVAFQHYDDGLAQRLQLCVRGLYLVPCEAPEVAGAPVVRPDPALRSLPQR